MILDCENCGKRFDTEREPVTPHADTNRCPGCGHQHDPHQKPAVQNADDLEPVAQDEGAAMAERVAASLETADGDVHFHFHQHDHREADGPQ